MDDTISRQAAIDVLERKKDKNAKGDIGWLYNKIIQNDIDALMQLPSAQSGIIRCKDCKRKRLENMVWTCPFGFSGGENFFCGYGQNSV